MSKQRDGGSAKDDRLMLMNTDISFVQASLAQLAHRWTYDDKGMFSIWRHTVSSMARNSVLIVHG
jgi:hypothetical protein